MQAMRRLGYGFNSKLVRLKADFDYVFLFLPSRFNSKLVRLKGLRFDKPFLVSTGFQFQTGAIKSRTVIDDSYPRFFGFNSKLVRLKDAAAVADIRDVKTVSIPNWCD